MKYNFERISNNVVTSRGYYIISLTNKHSGNTFRDIAHSNELCILKTMYIINIISGPYNSLESAITIISSTYKHTSI